MFPMETEYVDDRRSRDGGPDFVPPEERQRRTQELFTKGGWWDHSGGNRITTTDGDKLEIVRGNYRLAVLGRQPPGEEGWADSAGLDMSGGIIGMKQRLPTKTKSISWVDTWGGTWAVVKETRKGDFKETSWGNVKSESYGDKFESFVGSDSPGDETPNPDITEKTWAKTITERKGSASKPIDSIKKETWIENMQEHTFALAQSSSTEALTIQSATNAGAITETTTYLANTSATIGGLSESTTVLALARDVSVLGGKISVSAATLRDKVAICGAKVEVSAGNRVDVSAGDKVGVRLGNELEVAIGNNIGVTLAPVIVGLTVAPISLEAFLGIGLSIGLVKFKIGISSDENKDKNSWKGLVAKLA